MKSVQPRVAEKSTAYDVLERLKKSESWQTATLESLISDGGIFVDGDWVESKDQDPNGDVRLIQLADVGDGTFRDRSERFLTSEKARELSCTILVPNDLLVARMPDPLGRACIFPGDKKPSVTVVDVAVVRPRNSEVNTRWLMYCINSPQFRRAVASMQSGSTRQRISRKNLARITFRLPPRLVQDGVVDEIEKQFSRLDEAVTDLERVKTNLKRYKATVLKSAVDGHLVVAEAELARREARKYETGNELLRRICEARRNAWNNKGEYKESAAPNSTELPELPEGWAWASMGQVGNVIGGLTKNPKRNALRRKLPYLRVANVYADELRLDEVERIGVAENELERLRLQADDLLIVEGNGSVEQIGRVARWDGSIEPCVHQNHLIKVRLSCMSPRWVLLWMLSPQGRRQIESAAASTSGLYTLSTGKVGRLAVPVPPLAEQHRVVAEVDRCLSIGEGLKSQVFSGLRRAGSLHNAILRKTLSE